MPLTPADVHNVAFSKPPIGKRGYNEDEVDAFLDLVEQEISRLAEENSDLQQRVFELKKGGSPAPAPAAAPLVQPSAPSSVAQNAGQSAARLLTMAQETADRVTAEAQHEANSLVSGAKANSEKLLGDARRAAESLTAESRQKAESLLSDAKSKSESQLAQARAHADQMSSDAERKHAESVALINKERTHHEGRIDQLKTYEREYRTRLKSFLESQLSELENRGTTPAGDAAKSSR